MPKMVLDRNVTLRSRLGYTVRMRAGKPTQVPSALVQAAMAYGAKAVDTEGEAQVKQAIPKGEGDAPKANTRVTYQEKQTKMVELIEEAVAKGTPDGTFTATGVPNAKWLEKQIGDPVNGKERDEAWLAYNKKMRGDDTVEASVSDKGETTPDVPGGADVKADA